MLYTEKDLEKSMDKIETVNFHQVGTFMSALKEYFVKYIYNALVSYHWQF